MSSVVLSVPDISCEHCEKTVTGALGQQAGVSLVRVDIPAKTVRLDYDESAISIDQVKAILAEEDYPVESVSAA